MGKICVEMAAADGHILGDSAYPNLSFVLTPFRDNGHLTDREKLYNRTHSSIRIRAEHGFGLLKGRFVRLQNIQQNSSEVLVSTIVSGCVLHNICLMHDDQLEESLEDDPVPQPLPNPVNYDGNAQEAGAVKRLRIARLL